MERWFDIEGFVVVKMDCGDGTDKTGIVDSVHCINLDWFALMLMSWAIESLVGIGIESGSSIF